ncbi:MAG: hypothetical protein NVSMB29_06700 [Candidatus Dormibacteria bacterium]
MAEGLPDPPPQPPATAVLWAGSRWRAVPPPASGRPDPVAFGAGVSRIRRVFAGGRLARRHHTTCEDKKHMAVSGYCLKCKKQTEIKDAQEITMKNGKPATTGTCPTCSTKIYKIGKAS